MTLPMAMTMTMAMAMAMAMAPQVVPCADFKKSTFFKSQNEHFCKKNTKIKRIWPRDHVESIDLDERILMHLARAP